MVLRLLISFHANNLYISYPSLGQAFFRGCLGVAGGKNAKMTTPGLLKIKCFEIKFMK